MLKLLAIGYLLSSLWATPNNPIGTDTNLLATSMRQQTSMPAADLSTVCLMELRDDCCCFPIMIKYRRRIWKTGSAHAGPLAAWKPLFGNRPHTARTVHGADPISPGALTIPFNQPTTGSLCRIQRPVTDSVPLTFHKYQFQCVVASLGCFIASFSRITRNILQALGAYDV
jgi:hypothetical protein